MWIDSYIQDMELRWSETTKRSERARLERWAPAIDGNPATLWAAVRHLAPYSRTTTWTRVVAYVDWTIETGHQTGPNPYRAFRSKNFKQFKNTYQRRVPQLSFEEAVARINTLSAPGIREKALQLLYSGMRWSESLTLQDGWVIGKGGKRRRVPQRAQGVSAPLSSSYHAFYRELRKVGLKPHDLRKLALNHYVAAGANPFELAAIAGWSSINTAQSYIETLGVRLEQLHQEAFK